MDYDKTPHLPDYDLEGKSLGILERAKIFLEYCELPQTRERRADKLLNWQIRNYFAGSKKTFRQTIELFGLTVDDFPLSEQLSVQRHPELDYLRALWRPLDRAAASLKLSEDASPASVMATGIDALCHLLIEACIERLTCHRHFTNWSSCN